MKDLANKLIKESDAPRYTDTWKSLKGLRRRKRMESLMNTFTIRYIIYKAKNKIKEGSEWYIKKVYKGEKDVTLISNWDQFKQWYGEPIKPIYSEVVHKLSEASGLTLEEVLEKVRSLPCTYDYAYSFYMTMGRFPSHSEAALIPVEIIASYRDMIDLDGK